MPRPASETWMDYWKRDDFWIHSRLWEESAKLQAEKLPAILGLTAEDTVLTLGCGAGHLEAMLAPKVKEIVATDVSEKFVEETGRRTRGFGNVTVKKQIASSPPQTLAVPRNDASLRASVGSEAICFSVFLCISVVQYFSDISEIGDLILSCSKMSAPGARMLIADLSMKRSLTGQMADALGSALLARERKYFRLFLRESLSCMLLASHYKNVQRKNPGLEFTWEELERFCKHLPFSSEIVRLPLSCHVGRPSLLIQF